MRTIKALPFAIAFFMAILALKAGSDYNLTAAALAALAAINLFIALIQD